MNIESILKDLKTEFSNNHKIKNIGILCYNTLDEEALSDTAYFVGKTWESITENDWSQKWNAISFFSNYGFYYFMPSIMMAALKNFHESHMAFFEVFNTLYYMHPLSKNNHEDESYYDKWIQFNSRQLELLKKIIFKLGNDIKKYDIDFTVFLMVKEILLSMIKNAKKTETMYNFVF